jgi:hypothetical protein
MPKLIVTLVASVALLGAGVITGRPSAMPIGDFAISTDLSANLRQITYQCSRRYRCWWPSYYDTPEPLRPRIFYGYAPHRDGEWYSYMYGRDWFGYRSWR